MPCFTDAACGPGSRGGGRRVRLVPALPTTGTGWRPPLTSSRGVGVEQRSSGGADASRHPRPIRGEVGLSVDRNAGKVGRGLPRRAVRDGFAQRTAERISSSTLSPAEVRRSCRTVRQRGGRSGGSGRVGGRHRAPGLRLARRLTVLPMTPAAAGRGSEPRPHPRARCHCPEAHRVDRAHPGCLTSRPPDSQS